MNKILLQCPHVQMLCIITMIIVVRLFCILLHSPLLELSYSPRQWPPHGPPNHSPQLPLPLFPPRDQYHRIIPSSTAVLRRHATPLPLRYTHQIRRRTPTKWWRLRQIISLWGASWARGSLDQFSGGSTNNLMEKWCV